MAFPDSLLIIPGAPVLSVMALLVLLSLLLYFARFPAHRSILALSRVLHNGLRLSAHSVMLAEKRLNQRNREVLLASGREAAEHIIEREFERIDATIRRDLAEYPALQRQLSEEITAIDEDYQKSTEVPPSPPGWVKAVEAVAKISAKDDPMVGNILSGIHGSLVKAHEKALAEYRKGSHERHRLLKGMMPHWRKLLTLLSQTDKRINSLLERSRTIDTKMDEYEEITKQTDRAVSMLSSSAMTQFFIASFVLAIAIGGAIINFNLIARPMQEMVGGASYLMGYKTANIAAMVIILVEVAMGLFLMESLRITRLFPVIGALDDKLRVRMIWVTFTILTLLASIEAGLAFMRERLSQEDAALVADLLSNSELVAATSNQWITTAAQMGMGFILPFALTFVAIPLESFIHSLRTVVGTLVSAVLRAAALILRLLGNVAHHGGSTLVNIYDLTIFLPMWFEKLIKNRKRNRQIKSFKEKHGAVRSNSNVQDTGEFQIGTRYSMGG